MSGRQVADLLEQGIDRLTLEPTDANSKLGARSDRDDLEQRLARLAEQVLGRSLTRISLGFG
jgi:hypothetical protein